MAINTRESRISLDSGYSDDKNNGKRSKSKNKRDKSSQRRKVCKDDIGKPLNDLRHTAHIGTSGESFGDIAADMSKVADLSVFDKDFITKALVRQEKDKTDQNRTRPPSCEKGKSKVVSCDNIQITANPITDEKSDDSEIYESTLTEEVLSLQDAPLTCQPAVTEPAVTEEVIMRHRSVPSRLRHSVFSWNLEFDQSDILTSVLAVMDQLNVDNVLYNRISPTLPMRPEIHNGYASACLGHDSDPIYDEVPIRSPAVPIRSPACHQVQLYDKPDASSDENRSVRVQRTETVIERIIKKQAPKPPNMRPKFKPPTPKECTNECLYDVVGLRSDLLENTYDRKPRKSPAGGLPGSNLNTVAEMNEDHFIKVRCN